MASSGCTGDTGLNGFRLNGFRLNGFRLNGFNGGTALRRGAALLAAALGFTACGEDDECAGVKLPACNVFNEQCRAEVFAATACEYTGGRAATAPAVQIIELEELQDALREDLAMTEPDPDEQLWDRAVTLFKLQEPASATVDGQVEALTGGLLGFYTNTTKRIVLVHQPDPLAEDEASRVLAHEYVHALQDQTFGIAAYFEDRRASLDAELAARAVLEGEATLFEHRLQVGQVGERPENIDWLGFYESGVTAANEYTAEELDPLPNARKVFPYTYGAYGVARAYLKTGMDGIAALRDGEPSDSHWFLARRYGDAALTFAEGAADSALPAEPPVAFTLNGSYVLGAWLLHGFLLRNFKVSAMPALALAWEADSFNVFSGEQGEVGALWAVRFRDADKSAAFTELIDGSELSAEVCVQRAAETVYLASSDVGFEAACGLLATHGKDSFQWPKQSALHAPFAAYRGGGTAPGRLTGTILDDLRASLHQ